MNKLILSVLMLCLFACAKSAGTYTQPSLSNEMSGQLAKDEALYEAKDVLTNDGKDFKTFGDTLNRAFYYSASKGGPILKMSYWNFDAVTADSPKPTLSFISINLRDGGTVPATSDAKPVDPTATPADPGVSGALTCAAKDDCKNAVIVLTKADGSKFAGTAELDIVHSVPSSVTAQENTSKSETADDYPTLDLLNAIKLDTMASALQTISVKGTATKLYRLKIQFAHQAANDAVEKPFKDKVLFLNAKVGAPQFTMAFGHRLAPAPQSKTAAGGYEYGPNTGTVVDSADGTATQITFDGNHRLSSIVIQK